MRSTAITLKTFSLLICFILISSISGAVKILRPGDVVKGKVIDQKYYCLTEKENTEILNKLNTVELLQKIITMKQAQLDAEESTTKLHLIKQATKEDKVALYELHLSKEKDRSRRLEKEVKKQEQAKIHERTWRKIYQIISLAAAAAAVAK